MKCKSNLVMLIILVISVGCLCARGLAQVSVVVVLESEKLPVAAHGLVVLDDGASVLVAETFAS